jgi:hypothetical protein
MFGQDSIRFAGSRAAVARDANTVLADYFGLPMDYDATVTFSPKVQSFSADIAFYLGLDEFWEGLYFRMNAPIVYTRWDLGEEIATGEVVGIQGHPEGYYDSVNIPRATLNDTILTAWAGTKSVGDLEALTHAKVDGRQADTRLSDINFVLGWNFFCDESYHLGLNLRVSAPTGTTTTGEFLFEPVIGDHKRWNFGGGLSASAMLWEDDCSDSSIGVFLDANITHLFRKTMKRTFDLKDKTGSRYMPVLQSRTTGITIEQDGGGADFARQYNGTLVPFANISTIDASISAGVQADVVLKFGYKNCGLSVDLGYNLWARSAEKLSGDSTLEIADIATFALKGDASLYGFRTVANVDQADGLSVSQSGATLFSPAGTTPFNIATTAATYTNTNSDAPTALVDDNVGTNNLNNLPTTDAAGIALFAGGAAQVRSSVTQSLLANSQIDEESGLSKSAISHKIFGHISYAWEDECAVDPFVGVGASAEFASNGTTNATTTSSKGCALSQWRVELKGGIAF